MRILMLSEFYPPIIGGMERHVQTLSHELVRRGHHVVVATLQQEGLSSFEEDRGVRVYRLKGWNTLLAPFYEDRKRQYHLPVPDPRVMASLKKIIEIEQPDIVHARRWMLYSFVGLKAWSGAKLVVTLHDYSLFCPKLTYLYINNKTCTGADYIKCMRCSLTQYGISKGALLTTGLKLSSILHKYVDKYIAVSSSVRDASIVEIDRYKKQIEVVPTFISDTAIDESNDIERPIFLPPTDNYILYVGRLSTFKGVHILLEAYDGLSEIAPLVLMVTNSEDEPKTFPKGVKVVRNVPHSQVMAGWKHCAVGVVPSVWPEPFPQVAIEAMACGKPVIASDAGGLHDMIMDGESGLLIEPGNTNELHEALKTLLLDPARREQMGKAGRERAKMFMVGNVTNRIEEIYRELLDEKNVAHL